MNVFTFKFIILCQLYIMAIAKGTAKGTAKGAAWGIAWGIAEAVARGSYWWKPEWVSL